MAAAVPAGPGCGRAGRAPESATPGLRVHFGGELSGTQGYPFWGVPFQGDSILFGV